MLELLDTLAGELAVCVMTAWIIASMQRPGLKTHVCHATRNVWRVGTSLGFVYCMP